VAPALEKTRYRLTVEAVVILRDPVTGEERQTSGTLADSIAHALAPVLAKHVTTAVTTPEGMLALACLPLIMVAGEHLIDIMMGKKPTPSAPTGPTA
jgi:hypothetical protein